jgi:hypothetical protein
MPSPGDRFSFALPDGTTAIGRVLLDVARQCAEPQLIDPRSPLATFKRAFLVEVPARLQSVFIDGDAFASGAFTLVGNARVDVEAVEPPPAILVPKRRPHLAWGELMLPLALDAADAEALKLRPAVWPSARLGEACATPSLLAASDARLHAARARIEAAALAPLSGYAARARAAGFDLARFYPRAVCRHCLSPFVAGSGRCAICGRLAEPIELSVSDLRGPRRRCPSCATLVLQRADACPSCKADLPKVARIPISDDLRITYETGNVHSPMSLFGQIKLTIDGRGEARLDNQRRGSARAWSGRVARSAISELLDHLIDAAFPAVDQHPIPADSLLRSLTLTRGGSDENALIAWNAVETMVGYRDAFVLLDALVRQLSGGELTFRPDSQPQLVEGARPIAS